MRKIRSKWIGLIVLILLQAIPAKAAAPKAKHVIIIGLDGWGSYSVERANMPHVKQLMKNGSHTLQKRTVLPSSSAVNWSSMFMGAGPELHGYTQWGSKVPDLPSRTLNSRGIFPTIFGLLHDANPKAEIGTIYEWETIKCLVDSAACDYFEQAANYKENPAQVVEMAEKYIQEKRPNLLFLCWDNPDYVGHQIGHDTPEYYEKLVEMDRYIGRIVEAVRSADMIDNTIFIITSDHGGINKGHGKISMQEMETPFIIAGKNIRQGHLIEASMMQFDVAATIAEIFGLKTPQVWIGRSISEIFK